MTPEEYIETMIARDYQKIVDLYDPDAPEPNSRRQCNRLRGYTEALLRAGYAAKSIDMFGQLIKQETRSFDTDYNELAAAQWLHSRQAQSDVEDTITNLRRALKCNYGDSAKNMTPALLLYYVAVRTKDEVLKQEAIGEINSKLATGWAKNWPAPLGRFLIGVADENHVEEELADQHPLRQPDERCRYEFYRGVKLLEAGNEVAARQHFRTAVDLPAQKTSTTEFVFARDELGETPTPSDDLGDVGK